MIIRTVNNITVRAVKIYRAGGRVDYSFRAYMAGSMRHFSGRLKTDGDILGDISTLKSGSREDNEKNAISNIMAVFPEISGISTIYSGYVIVSEDKMPPELLMSQ